MIKNANNSIHGNEPAQYIQLACWLDSNLINTTIFEGGRNDLLAVRVISLAQVESMLKEKKFVPL